RFASGPEVVDCAAPYLYLLNPGLVPRAFTTRLEPVSESYGGFRTMCGLVCGNEPAEAKRWRVVTKPRYSARTKTSFPVFDCANEGNKITHLCLRPPASRCFITTIVQLRHVLPRDHRVHKFPFAQPRAMWAATERVIHVEKHFFETAI